jgi:hypothetical protein
VKRDFFRPLIAYKFPQIKFYPQIAKQTKKCEQKSKVLFIFLQQKKNNRHRFRDRKEIPIFLFLIETVKNCHIICPVILPSKKIQNSTTLFFPPQKKTQKAFTTKKK